MKILRTLHTMKFLFVGLFALTLVVSDTALAQEEPIEGSATVADVALVDVQPTEEGEVLTGTFALQGKMGQENDIVYGILVLDAKQTIVDAKYLGQVASLMEGERKTLNYRYEIPTHLSGTLSVALLVENKEGMTLGMKEITKKERGDGSSGLSCAVNEEALDTFSCESAVDTTLSVAYAKSTPLTERIPGESSAVSKGGKVSFTPDIAPGRYFAFVTNSYNETAVVPVLKKGEYGNILNTAVYKKADGALEAVVSVYGSLLTDATLSLVLKNKDGAVCTEQSKVLEEPVFVFPVDAGCVDGTVAVEFKNKEGKILDTKTESFSVLSIEGSAEFATSESSKTVSPSLLKYILFGLVGLGLVVFLVALIKRKRGVLFGMVVFATSLTGLASAQEAQALTQYVFLYSTARGEFAWTSWNTTTLDKATYAPGETATISGSGNISWDAGAPLGSSGNSYITYFQNASNTAPAFDSEAIGTQVTVAYSGEIPRTSPVSVAFSGTATFTIPASMTSGAHSIRYINSSVSGGCTVANSRPCTGTRTANNPLGFSVVAAPAVCDLGCGGSMQWRTNSSSAINDFTCPSGSKLVVNDGSWTGPGACSGTYTRDPGGSFSCQVNAACAAPTTPCWQLTSTRSVSAASCTDPESPPRGPAFPACTAGNQGALDYRCDDDQPLLDVRSQRTCGMCAGSPPPPPSCTWQEINSVNGFAEVQNNSRNEDICDPTKPSWFISRTCPGSAVAGGDSSSYANGYSCYDSASKFKGTAPTYEPGMCMAKAYVSRCASPGPAPTVNLTVSRVVTSGNALLSRVIAFFKDLIPKAEASGTFTIVFGQSPEITLTTANASMCTPVGAWAQPIVGTSGSRVQPGLAIGTHVFTISCWGPAGGPVQDSVTIIVTGPASVTDFTATPNPITVGDSTTLTWTTSPNADSCIATGGWGGPKSFPNGSETVSPLVTTTYTLECWDDGASTGSRPVTVTVFPASTLKICLNSCSSNLQITDPIAMNDTDSSRNIVACYSPASGCNDASANVTSSAVWSESGANAVTLSGSNPKVLSPNLLPAPGTVVETVTATHAGRTASFNAAVSKFCASGCTAAQDATVCLGSTYTAASPTAGCGAVMSTCNGTRLCDFNWKEVAP